MTNLITDQTSSSILDMLDGQGLGVDRAPDLNRPSLPEDITELGDEELMVLYTQFVSFSDFVNTQLSCAIIDEKELERLVDVAESGELMRQTGLANAKTSVTAIKALVELADSVREAKIAHIQKYAYRKLLETLANNSERDSAVCSRELTRRTSGDNFKTRSRKFTA